MTERVPRTEYPWWVKLSVLGVPGRAGLWAFVKIALLSGLAVLGYAWYVDPRLLLAAPLIAAVAIPYWLSIRWIDAHGSWDAEP